MNTNTPTHYTHSVETGCNSPSQRRTKRRCSFLREKGMRLKQILASWRPRHFAKAKVKSATRWRPWKAECKLFNPSFKQFTALHFCNYGILYHIWHSEYISHLFGEALFQLALTNIVFYLRFLQPTPRLRRRHRAMSQLYALT